MEPNQPVEQPTSLQPTPPQPVVPPTPVVTPQPKTSKLPTILLILFSILSLSGLVYYYLQTQSLNKELLSIKSETNPTSIPPETLSPRPSPSTTWITKTYSLKPGFEGGEIIANLEFKVPSGWTVETSARAEKGILKECNDYLIKTPDSTTTLTLSPVCTSWGAQYTPWPSGAKVVMQRQQGSNSGTITKYRVRYSNSQNQLTFVDADDKEQIMDVMMITFSPPDDNKYDYYFVPFSLTTTSIENSSTIEIIDQIAASVNLK